MTTVDGTTMPELVIVTGMSGAGRSTAGDVLEDLGWFVVDNLPPGLLPTLLELGARSQGAVPRIAAVVDVRGRSFFSDLRTALETLAASGVSPRIVFLEASDEALVRRFESVRRKHPLQADGRITDGIDAERVLLEDLRGDADLVIDTSALNVHELRAAVEDALAGPVEPSPAGDLGHLRLQVRPSGRQRPGPGLPLPAQPALGAGAAPSLRPRPGGQRLRAGASRARPTCWTATRRYSRLIAPGYLREGKRFVTIAVGCTGGKHRSVAMAKRSRCGWRSGDRDAGSSTAT